VAHQANGWATEAPNQPRIQALALLDLWLSVLLSVFISGKVLALSPATGLFILFTVT
jgi:hypothetical protein